MFNLVNLYLPLIILLMLLLLYKCSTKAGHKNILYYSILKKPVSVAPRN